MRVPVGEYFVGFVFFEFAFASRAPEEVVEVSECSVSECGRGVGGDADEIVVCPFGYGGQVHEGGDGFAASRAAWHEDEWTVACFDEFHEGGGLRCW